jgi:hypothetical protein
MWTDGWIKIEPPFSVFRRRYERLGSRSLPQLSLLEGLVQPSHRLGSHRVSFTYAHGVVQVGLQLNSEARQYFVSRSKSGVQVGVFML